MDSKQLFTELVHRLQRYDDSMVLHAVIQQQADVTELRTSGVSEFLCKRFGLQLTEMRSPN